MKKILLSLLICAGFVALNAQTAPPFRKEIDAFIKKDSVKMPTKGMILFVGSSSFTKWTDVQDYFPGYPILNRGFGGSTLPDVIRYADEIIYPYEPRQVVIYCGENDVASSDTITAQIVYDRFVKLFSMIRYNLPKAAIAFVSLKPSPSRWKRQPVVVEANSMIKKFIKKQKRADFIDIYGAMLDTDGRPFKDIFVSDSLHMNAKGYAIWQPIIKKKLNR